MREGPEIVVFSAFCTAPTSLAAFDRALQQGGAHDVNLIALSSIVPAGASITRGKLGQGAFEVGARVYCVMADQRVTEPGSEAWAGISWAVDAHGRGGLFVEAHGGSERQVRFELEESLATLISDRPYMDCGPPEIEIAGGMCEDLPGCALAIAIFGAEYGSPRA